MKKGGILARKGLFALGLVVFTSLALGVSGGGKPRPRLMDLVNTRIRGAAMDLSMDIIPKPMVDPAIDDGAVFSYFARPSVQMGIRGEPFATQMVDGHLWTGAAEWMLLLGDKPEPVNQRIWTPYKGYLPCFSYTVQSGGVDYTVSAFQFRLDSGGYERPVNFIRITARNPGDKTLTASFAGGFSYGMKDHRSQQMRQVRFNPLWKYEMTDSAALRDGKVIYAWNKTPDRLLARPGREYKNSFRGAGRKDPVCLATYRKDLGPGEEMTAEFVMPHYPADPSAVSALLGADFGERQKAFEHYWDQWLTKGARFEVSETKVVNATRSYVIHALMSQDVISDNEVEQHVNRLQYNRFWLRDSCFFVSMYENWGQTDVARALCRHFFAFQKNDGNFLSQRGQLDGWGQATWALGNHVRYTGDAEFAREALPYVERAIGWLETALADDAWGLMPPTDAMDNESILGRYTGHNFWALTGLDASADLARAAGREDLAERYRKLYQDYCEHFLARLREVAEQRDGVIPPGLDVPGGTDWGNLLAVYPGFIMDPFDPLVTATFDYFRRERMQEGIAMWQKSMHHYVTERVAQTAIIRGEQERALDDFYAMLLHTGSCHEGFEWSIFAWDGRDYCIDLPGVQTCNFTPHGWYAASMNILFRNMLIREEGNELHLLSAVSPRWSRPGDSIRAIDAPTWFGPMSFEASFRETSATLEMKPDFRRAPAAIIVHVPYFLKVTGARADGKKLDASGTGIRVSPRARRVDLEFERLQVEPRSYEHSVEWYKSEYRRRFEERSRHGRN